MKRRDFLGTNMLALAGGALAARGADAADAIGRKAQELLASLPEGHRSFNLEAVRPGHWWLI